MSAGHVGATAASVIISWLLSKRVPAARVDVLSGRFVLDYPLRYIATVVAFFIAACGFVVLGLVAWWEDWNKLLFAFMIIGPIWLYFGLAIYDALCVQLSFSPQALVKTTPLGGQVWVPWQGVTKVSYSTLTDLFTFSSSAGAVRVTIFRNGLGTLAEVAEEALKSTPLGKAPHLLFEKASNAVISGRLW